MAKRYHVLPSAAWQDGGNIQIPVKDLPKNARVRAFVFRLEGLFTTGAAAALIASTQLHRLVSMIDLGGGVRATGAFWHFLEWAMRGGEVSLPAAIPATNAQTFRRYITWAIPFYDKRAQYPADSLPVGAQFAESVISIDTAKFSGLGNNFPTLASITGTLRAYAILDEPNASPGSDVRFGYADLTGQAPTMDGGVIVDAFVYREDCSAITSAQIATAAMQIDGAAFGDTLRLSEYTRNFNDAMSLGTDVQASSATVPVAGEMLPESPDVAQGAADVVTTPFLPLITPGYGYKVTKLPRVESQLRVDFTGTDVAFRVGYRKIYGRSAAEMVQAFRRAGRSDIVSVSQIAAKTGSKRSLSRDKAHYARFLPLRALAKAKA